MESFIDVIAEAAEELSAGEPDKGFEAGSGSGVLWFGDDAACDPSMGACGNLAQPVEGASRAIASGMEQNPTDIDDEELDDGEGNTAMSVSPTMLSVLAKNRAGTWWSSQRSRNPLWSFF